MVAVRLRDKVTGKEMVVLGKECKAAHRSSGKSLVATREVVDQIGVGDVGIAREEIVVDEEGEAACVVSRGRKDMHIQRRSKRQDAFVIDALYIMRGGEDKRVAMGEIIGEIEAGIEKLLTAVCIGDNAKGGERAEETVKAIAVVEMAMGKEDASNGTMEREDGVDVATIDKPTGVRSAGGDKGIGTRIQ